MDNLCVQSRNTGGIRDSLKRKKLFHLLNNSNKEIFLLQETHSSPEDEELWKKEWGGDIVFAYGSHHSRGVAILFKKNIKYQWSNEQKDSHGRIIAVELNFSGRTIAIINLYGPNTDEPTFFEHLISCLDRVNTHEYIIGGDWNVVQNVDVDRFGSKIDSSPKSRNIIHSWIEEDNLIDIWRIY